MPVKSMDEITSLLQQVKFKKRLLGGVDEDDVWRILEKLQQEYRLLVEATEQRFGGLLDERNEKLHKQQKEIDRLREMLKKYEGGDANESP